MVFSGLVEGASKPSHSKGFALDKNYAAVGETLALPARPGAIHKTDVHEVIYGKTILGTFLSGSR